jgi:hypothetical protein
LPGIRKIGLDMAGAVQLARLAPRQRHDIAAADEVTQGGVSDQPGRAGDHNLLVRHLQNSRDNCL